MEFLCRWRLLLYTKNFRGVLLSLMMLLLFDAAWSYPISCPPAGENPAQVFGKHKQLSYILYIYYIYLSGFEIRLL